MGEDGYRSPAGTWELIRKSVLEDFGIPSTAKVILLYLASKPAAWVVNEEHLIRVTGWPTNRVRKALRDLRRLGYIREDVERKPGGTIVRRTPYLRRELVVSAGRDLDERNLDASKPDSSPDQAEREKPQVGTWMHSSLTQAQLDASKSSAIEKTESFREDGVSSEDGKTLDQLPLIVGVASPPAKPADNGFAVFWKIYPRGTAKGAAEKAYEKAAKKTDPRLIIAGAERFRDDPNLPEPRFVPHASTWLNGRRWEDGPLPSRNGGGSRKQQGLDARAAYLAALDAQEEQDHDTRRAITS